MTTMTAECAVCHEPCDPADMLAGPDGPVCGPCMHLSAAYARRFLAEHGEEALARAAGTWPFRPRIHGDDWPSPPDLS